MTELEAYVNELRAIIDLDRSTIEYLRTVIRDQDLLITKLKAEDRKHYELSLGLIPTT